MLLSEIKKGILEKKENNQDFESSVEKLDKQMESLLNEFLTFYLFLNLKKNKNRQNKFVSEMNRIFNKLNMENLELKIM